MQTIYHGSQVSLVQTVTNLGLPGPRLTASFADGAVMLSHEGSVSVWSSTSPQISDSVYSRQLSRIRGAAVQSNPLTHLWLSIRIYLNYKNQEILLRAGSDTQYGRQVAVGTGQ
ncbi:hypothetical protein J5N97_019946 [Dioscorea zingiberensis]|uniref:Uncharacterized protein n=1 Tax=Dioscorea zingiberensis TaxID=325984 RepID=A0A9D5HD72_9LILI|nr:hypothetical protein J5N97_019946 [Dioscorea zingiberensis]